MARHFARTPRTTSPLTWLLRILLVFLLVWFVGLMRFIYTLPEAPAEPLPPADGIVALTGGEARLVEAMGLLAAGKGQRLLISGVHPGTTRVDLKRVVVDPAGQFDCCVDLDKAARNTAGNAIETARWVRKNGYRTIILVTAQYHMPRSLLELKRELPDVTLVAYPVVPDKARARDWWHQPATAQLLASEYMKYLVARLRIGLAEQMAGEAALADQA